MDKQTEIMWEAEFVKQYPKPITPELLGLDQLEAVNKIVFQISHPELHKILTAGIAASLLKGQAALWQKAHSTYYEVVGVPRHFPKEISDSGLISWSNWYKECYDRFNAIFSAEPTYALEELRKGNLLIEGNV